MHIFVITKRTWFTSIQIYYLRNRSVLLRNFRYIYHVQNFKLHQGNNLYWFLSAKRTREQWIKAVRAAHTNLVLGKTYYLCDTFERIRYRSVSLYKGRNWKNY